MVQPSTAAESRVPTESTIPTPPRLSRDGLKPSPNNETTEASGTSRLAALRAAIREAWKRGDRQAALDNLADALSVQPVDAPSAALASEFAAEARDLAAAAAAGARDAGANTGTYEAAQAREREAARLEQTGQSIRAVRSYLEATELFARAAEEAERAATSSVPRVPRSSTVRPRQTPQPPIPGADRVPAETPAANPRTSPPAEPDPTSKPETSREQGVAPSALPGANEGQWIVRVDANCAGMVVTVDLYIDGMLVGTVTPGRGLVRKLPVGPHAVSGRSATNGYSWGPQTYDLTQSVLTTNFACD
jgi:hypothetical protein